ncbi:beta-ketoacyl-ACP synthase III [Zhaonella formicivorans]|uniref:beta-ketoacyl-ACP synthase III n=1 Tax=Zhaonella formicivorans TaxID=2528593 RepID=UPI0010D7B63A|nr:beta-ketoacyl-ACP synthase III [Zhaonella formicivorans]
MSSVRGVAIVGTGSAVPERVLTNDDLAKMVDTNDEWIRTRTGICERRIADANTATSDLCVLAAKRAIADAGISPGELDLIIVATVTPDMMFPATACLVQDRIGATKAGAFDLSAGCSGFLYGLATGSQFIAAGLYEKVLVIGAETLSKITDWEDRSTCVLFGDGAGAVVLQSAPAGAGVLSVHLGAAGSGGDLLTLPAGGSRRPTTAETVAKREHYIHMSGNEVFKFAVKVMGEASLKALEKCNKTKEDIDFLIPHQANIRIIEAAVKRLNLSPDKVYINLDRYGNTSAASVPVALDEAVKAGKVKKGDVVLLVAFGAGLTWGASVIEWSKG